MITFVFYMPCRVPTDSSITSITFICTRCLLPLNAFTTFYPSPYGQISFMIVPIPSVVRLGAPQASLLASSQQSPLHHFVLESSYYCQPENTGTRLCSRYFRIKGRTSKTSVCYSFLWITGQFVNEGDRTNQGNSGVYKKPNHLKRIPRLVVKDFRNDPLNANNVRRANLFR